MTELTNFEICKRIAEVEGLTCELREGLFGNKILYALTESHGGLKSYNPLKDDALCFQLMIKYRIELGVYGTWYGCFRGDKPKGSDGCLSYELSASRAICLAIIEAHNE
tara:strand:- start:379 stop:705 length:327 start_codon:yes stop_codon:yes gene_type:complete